MLGGRYKLLDELGSGGMAVVWRARDEVLGRPVAVKVLAGRFADDPQSRARIRHEARAAANLSHPNIAQVYDYGESTDGGTPLPYVVMELVNGPTLQQRVSGGSLPPRTIFRICGEVAAALAAAHADGLVHRDIKMANIMVTSGGAKVVDFGIAAAVGHSSAEEMLVGTPAYLAPERLTGDAVQPASDVYALGVLLYRLLAGGSPWRVETTTQMLSAHIYLEPEPLPDLPGVPPEVAGLVTRCLAKDSAARPTAAEVAAALGDAAESVSVRDGQAPPARHLATPAPGDFDELTGAAPRPDHAPAATRSKMAGSKMAGASDSEAAERLHAALSPASPPATDHAPTDTKRATPPTATDGAPINPDLPASPRAADSTSAAPTSASSGGAETAAPASTSSFPQAAGTASADPTSVVLRAGSAAPADRMPASRRAADTARTDPRSPMSARVTDAVLIDPKPGIGDATRVDRASAAPDQLGRSRGGRLLDPVRKRNRKGLVAGGALVAVGAAVLAIWGLSEQHAGHLAAGDAVVSVSAGPSVVRRTAVPDSTGDGSSTWAPSTGTDGHRLTGGATDVPSSAAGSSPTVTVSVTSSDPEASPQPSNSPAPQGVRLTSPGGSVYADCDGGKVTLSSWQAADGYTVQKVDPGPALSADIVFQRAISRYRMSVTCLGDTPTPVVLPL